MSFMSDYEKLMLKNIEENKKVLASLGLNKPFAPYLSALKKSSVNKQGTKRKRAEEKLPRKVHVKSNSGHRECTPTPVHSSEDGQPTNTRRRSSRLMGKEPGDFQGFDVELEDEEEEEKPKRKTPRNRENVFGLIPGIDVSTTWSTRLACSADCIHRPTVAGIHGNATEGCYSLALSGGYEDDLDYGDCFTYTGEGGRDLKGTKSNPKNLRTAPQSKDQTLSRGNLALTQNIEKGRPVRVIRGYKLDSPFAPEEGYRYDGIYTVEKYWQAVGMSGFKVFKFALKRSDNQAPALWHADSEEDNGDDNKKDDIECKADDENKADDNECESDDGESKDDKSKDDKSKDDKSKDVKSKDDKSKDDKSKDDKSKDDKSKDDKSKDDKSKDDKSKDDKSRDDGQRKANDECKEDDVDATSKSGDEHANADECKPDGRPACKEILSMLH